MAIVTNTLFYSLNVIKTQLYCTKKCARSSLRLPVFIKNNLSHHICLQCVSSNVKIGCVHPVNVVKTQQYFLTKCAASLLRHQLFVKYDLSHRLRLQSVSSHV